MQKTSSIFIILIALLIFIPFSISAESEPKERQWKNDPIPSFNISFSNSDLAEIDIQNLETDDDVNDKLNYYDKSLFEQLTIIATITTMFCLIRKRKYYSIIMKPFFLFLLGI